MVEPVDVPQAARKPRAAKRKHHHGDLRAVLVDAALAHVRGSGAATFSLRDATSAAGVTSGAAYRHFRSRADLLDEVVVIGFERLSRAMHKRSSSFDGVARVAATGRAYVAFAVDEPNMFALMFSPDGENGRTRAFQADFGAPNAAEQLRAALRGVGADDDVSVTHAWGLAHGLAALAAAGINMPKAQTEQAITAFARTVAET